MSVPRLVTWIAIFAGAAALAEGILAACAAAVPGARPWELAVLGPPLLLAIAIARRRDGSGLDRLALALFVAAACLRAISTCSPTFDALHLERPFFLRGIFLAAQIGLTAWVWRTRADPADRGAVLLIVLQTLNRDLFLVTPHNAALLAAITGAYALRDHARRPHRWLWVPTLLFLLWVGGSIAAGLDLERGLTAAAYLGSFAVVAAVIATGADDPARLLRFALAIVAGAAMTAVAAAAWVLALGHRLSADAALGTRLGLLYQHPNMLGPYLAAMAVLAVSLSFTTHGRRRAGLALLALPALALLALPALALVVLTDSRTSWLGVAAGLVAWTAAAAVRGRPTPRRCLGALGTLATIGVILLAVRGGDLLDPTRFERAIGFRLDAWSEAADVIAERPWLGVGPDTFPPREQVAGEPDTTATRANGRFSNTTTLTHPHNAFLYVAQSSGLPALVLLLVMLGAYVTLGLRAVRRDPAVAALVIACLGTSVAILTCGLLDDSQIFTTLLSRPEWVFLGIVAATTARPQTRTRPAITVTAAALLVFGIGLGLRGVAAGGARSLATIAARDGREGPVLPALELARRLDPFDSETRDRLIDVHATSRDVGAVRALLDDAVLRRPKDPWLWQRLGAARAASSDPRGAAEAYDRAVDLGRGSPDRALFHASRVAARLRAGDLDAGRSALREALRIDAGVIDRLPRRALADAQIDLAETLTALRDERLAGPPVGDRYAWWNLYHAARRAELPDLAAALLDDIDARFADHVEELAATAYQRGVTALAASDPAAAATYFERAAELGDPTSPAAVALYRTAHLSLAERDPRRRADALRDVADRPWDVRTEAQVYLAVVSARLAAAEETGDRDMVERLQRKRRFLVPSD